jgi:hypothetical protein
MFLHGAFHQQQTTVMEFYFVSLLFDASVFEMKKAGGSKTVGSDLWMLSQFLFIVGMPAVTVGPISVEVE